MARKKYLFVDRDGTLITEPEDYQVDSLAKLRIEPGAISAMRVFKQAGFELVMVTNQDGLGTDAFPQADFDAPHNMMLQIFATEGVHFDAIHIDPHTADSNAFTRKPNPGMLMAYLQSGDMDMQNSYVIGDRDSDIELAKRMGISGILYGQFNPEVKGLSWSEIVATLLTKPRVASIERKTNETLISATVNLDSSGNNSIQTGIGFFDHMLDQLALHGGFQLDLKAEGDLYIDEHHTVEDCAIVIGQAMRQALGNKRSIGRYGFVLPMDESLATTAIDLSGRPVCVIKDAFTLDKVGELSIEMVRHFVQTLAVNLAAAIHVEVEGENHHHMVEGIFKSLGRSLRQAISKQQQSVTSSKGLLE
ncbi:MAG: bifunctional histidinol-phosphatase/imidazoleglycerol-phosphate dehydratase HisB [Gammaproteobacteria bacterium]|nr:bifunctional histidinol-phosphatase/imidazoleglycerol-phosphate dehydratase HisB [Gammaproteobacteria bacterium]NNC97206.1 bifunctional histidinol-phosphatase/imidazoleglycerol-phosphate dehydratase HisB [Gammaproteobacteria bacterium]NNM14484.1 bifunctional histidinol-phosphatase/imidazoleglycerol-phosphate dehydratase HisB [Gammaproteobacteria bacterium]